MSINKKTYVYTGVLATVLGVGGMAYAASDDIKSAFSQVPGVGGMV